MIILDTNVVSELMRLAPSPQVEAWVGAQDSAQLFLTAVSAAELRFGIACLPAGQRRERLRFALDGILREDFVGRILPFDVPASEVYAQIGAERRAMGRPISQFDCQIAAIARGHGATVATRNTSDFQGCGLTLINPWSADKPDNEGNPVI